MSATSPTLGKSYSPKSDQILARKKAFIGCNLGLSIRKKQRLQRLQLLYMSFLPYPKLCQIAYIKEEKPTAKHIYLNIEWLIPQLSPDWNQMSQTLSLMLFIFMLVNFKSQNSPVCMSVSILLCLSRVTKSKFNQGMTLLLILPLNHCIWFAFLRNLFD